MNVKSHARQTVETCLEEQKIEDNDGRKRQGKSKTDAQKWANRCKMDGRKRSILTARLFVEPDEADKMLQSIFNPCTFLADLLSSIRKSSNRKSKYDNYHS